MRLGILSVPLAVVLWGSSAATAAVIQNLGTLGGSPSSGRAVNGAGQVAGFSYVAGSATEFHAFRYSGGAMVDLGTLGGTSSDAAGINAAGQVVGAGATRFDEASHAYRYVGTPGSGGVMQDLGTLGGNNSDARGINAAGQVVGYSDGVSIDPETTPSPVHAFLYTGTPGAGGVMADLGTLGGSTSYAFSINDAGQIAGTADTASDSALHAFRYGGVPGGGGGAMADLGTLGGTNSDGRAINAAGQVVGDSYVAGDLARHAFRYTGTPGAGGSMQDLGTLGGTTSDAFGINDAGLVVGYSDTAGNAAAHAFLYNGTMVDLDAWLDAIDPAGGARWTLTEARAINDVGLITGTGLYDDGPGGLSDGPRAFLLDDRSLVPEPACLGLFGLCGVALARRSRVSSCR
jgi:probable HAF family extracellular repeat protein